MAKHFRLKSRRTAEAHKIDRAIKYAERGVVGGESRINPKKVRHALEARYIPIYEEVPKPSRKRKKGRRHSP